MANITLFQFEEHGVRFVGTPMQPEWIAKDVCNVLGLANTSQAMSRLPDLEKGIYISDTLGGPQELLTIKESGLYRLMFTSRKDVAKRFSSWVTQEVLPQIRKTGSYSVADSSLETVPDIPQIKEAALMYREIYGEAYAQSYADQKMRKFYPALAGEPAPAKERSSLKSAEALLTPTQIAKELGFKYKTGNPNPQAVNTMLATLGYQEKIDNKWSATEKGKPYSDRKPVSTNSRSDKDQLFWYRSILDVLKSDSETLEAA